ncbi:hypothetical protein ABBQ32_005721 [Trebouxia sp. C0010 RCD-2024]
MPVVVARHATKKHTVRTERIRQQRTVVVSKWLLTVLVCIELYKLLLQDSFCIWRRASGGAVRSRFRDSSLFKIVNFKTAVPAPYCRCLAQDDR